MFASYGHTDLLVANNVLAHVPEPHDFLNGLSALVAREGVATFEFPHLMNLIEQKQFDTIYHEHFAYLSFTATIDLMVRSGLTVLVFRSSGRMAARFSSLLSWVIVGEGQSKSQLARCCGGSVTPRCCPPNSTMASKLMATQ